MFAMVAVPAPPALFTRVINSTVVQATWEPSAKMGQQEGFILYYRKVPVPLFTGPLTFPRNVTQYNITQLGESGSGGSRLHSSRGRGTPTIVYLAIQI